MMLLEAVLLLQHQILGEKMITNKLMRNKKGIVPLIMILIWGFVVIYLIVGVIFVYKRYLYDQKTIECIQSDVCSAGTSMTKEQAIKSYQLTPTRFLTMLLGFPFMNWDILST